MWRWILVSKWITFTRWCLQKVSGVRFFDQCSRKARKARFSVFERPSSSFSVAFKTRAAPFGRKSRNLSNTALHNFRCCASNCFWSFPHSIKTWPIKSYLINTTGCIVWHWVVPCTEKMWVACKEKVLLVGTYAAIEDTVKKLLQQDGSKAWCSGDFYWRLWVKSHPHRLIISTVHRWGLWMHLLQVI